METDQQKMKKLFSSVQKEIALLRKEFEIIESKKKILEQQATSHILAICPNYYKRILRASLDVSKLCHLEEIFSDKETMNLEILGYSSTVKKIYVESEENIMTILWNVEGNVSGINFTIQFTSHLLHDINVNEDIEIVSLQLAPQSPTLEQLSEYLKNYNLIHLLTPCLYMYQKMGKEKEIAIKTLESNEKIGIFEDNDNVLITLDFVSFDIKINWKIRLSESNYQFVNNIDIETSNDALRVFKNEPFLPVLEGEKKLNDAKDVLDFVYEFFED